MHSSTSSRALVLGAAAAWLALIPFPASAAGVVDFIADALANSPRLRVAEARIGVSREQAVRAGAWEAPVLEVGIVDLPTTMRFDQDPMTQKMVGVMQRVPIFGANGLARQSGARAAAADSAELAATRRDVLGQTWNAYAEAVAAVEKVAAARSHQGAMRRMAEAARARYEAGRGRLGEPLAAEAEAAEIAADMAKFEAMESAARARLATVSGFPTGRAFGPLDPLPENAKVGELAPWRQAVADHPRLRARAASQERFDLAARAARREQWPDLDVRASYGFRDNLDPEFAAAHGGVVQENMISASVAFSLPLFAGGREQAEARAMEAMANAEESERAQVELELLEMVESAHARARGGERVLTLLADTVLVLRERSLAAAWSAYSSGGSDLAEALEAAHTHYTSALEVADAGRELAMAQAELLSLTGRPELLGVTLPDATSRRKP